MTGTVDHRVALVIPALNESMTISDVVMSLLPLGQPIVIDDGSTDGTNDIARESGAIVKSHDRNLGIDAALASGLRLAVQHKFEFAITFDADGQHTAESARECMLELFSGADVVVGVRDHLPRWSEVVFSGLSTLLWGLRDPLCGLKGYRLSSIRAVNLEPTYCSIGTEICIRSVRAGLDVREVPITTQTRYDVSRFGFGIRPHVKILAALLKGCLI